MMIQGSIHKSANFLIKHHGDDAETFAYEQMTKSTSESFDKGVLWVLIITAIQELNEKYKNGYSVTK